MKMAYFVGPREMKEKGTATIAKQKSAGEVKGPDSWHDIRLRDM